MIIFDLDGTLADCEHRRHFVDSLGDHPDYYREPCKSCSDGSHHKIDPQIHKITGEKWKQDWKSFYEACEKDLPIEPVIEYWNDQISLGAMDANMIWSGRCESARDKTEKWLEYHILCFNSNQLKMRPIGNTEPDEVLKERWLDEAIAEGKTIDFVFDDRPKAIKMWRRRGIFVFNCCQHDEEF